MARYVTKKDWAPVSTELLTNFEGQVIGQVVTYEGSLVDQHSNTVIDNGALQVKVTADGVNKVKTFKGETAHSNAERFISDMRMEIIKS
jgi:hypothetical protein